MTKLRLELAPCASSSWRGAEADSLGDYRTLLMVDKALHSGTIHTLVQCARATAHVRPWAHSCLLFGPFGCSSAVRTAKERANTSSSVKSRAASVRSLGRRLRYREQTRGRCRRAGRGEKGQSQGGPIAGQERRRHAFRRNRCQLMEFGSDGIRTRRAEPHDCAPVAFTALRARA
jgi:hypothetical protein